MKLHAFTKKTVKVLLELTRIFHKPIGLENLPKTGGYIIASNHTSNVDPIRLGVQIPGYIRYLAKKEMFKYKFSRIFFTKLGAIPLDRGSADVAAVKSAEKVIADGGFLVIFPEGHRMKIFDRNKGKKGAEYLSAKTGCPIIPVGIKGRDMLIGRPLYGATTEEIMNNIGNLLEGIQ